LAISPYYVQRSSNDVKHRRIGCRSYFWDKDTGIEIGKFDPGKKDAIVMIDVDHYIDMPRMLANYPRVYLISTFQPTNVAKDTGEYTFTFNENDEVIYKVSGGAEYIHQIWNYATDILTAVTPTFARLGYNTVYYNIDRKKLDDHHQVVMLTPIKTFWSPLINLTWLVGGRQLRRLKVSNGKFTRLDIITKDGMYVATGTVNQYNSAVVTASQDSTLHTMSVMDNKIALSMAQVKTTVGDVNNVQAAVLTEYHRQKHGSRPGTVYPVEAAISRYQFNPHNYDPHAKPSLTPYMRPFIHFAASPDLTDDNVERAVKGRVEEVRTSTKLTPQMSRYIDEFCALVVPESITNTVHPADLEEVYERQSRPTQRAILDKAAKSAATSSNKPVQSFMKREPYADVKDPRIISTIPAETKMNYSRFIYAFTERIINPQKWYAFGKTPAEIASRVVEILANAHSAVNTDLSRFDGHVSEVQRALERAALLRSFHTSYHAELIELYDKTINQHAYTTSGYHYLTGLSRLSGSPDTAVGNSLINTFMAYVTYRRQGLGVCESYEKLGIYGGDDGLSTDVDPNLYIKTCEDIGQVLEVEQIFRHGPGISFLSRQFSPYVWTGAADSCCDLPRTLMKIPLAVQLPPNVTPLQKLGQKILALYLTDENTPVIRELISAYLTVAALPQFDEQHTTDQSWWVRYDKSEQFPNQNTDNWMEDYLRRSLPTFDYALFKDYAANVKGSMLRLLCPPMCVADPDVLKANKLTTVVNGDVVCGTGGSSPSGGAISPAASASSGTKHHIPPHTPGRVPSVHRATTAPSSRPPPQTACLPRDGNTDGSPRPSTTPLFATNPRKTHSGGKASKDRHNKPPETTRPGTAPISPAELKSSRASPGIWAGREGPQQQLATRTNTTPEPRPTLPPLRRDGKLTISQPEPSGKEEVQNSGWSDIAPEIAASIAPTEAPQTPETNNAVIPPLSYDTLYDDANSPTSPNYSPYAFYPIPYSPTSPTNEDLAAMGLPFVDGKVQWPEHINIYRPVYTRADDVIESPSGFTAGWSPYCVSCEKVVSTLPHSLPKGYVSGCRCYGSRCGKCHRLEYDCECYQTPLACIHCKLSPQNCRCPLYACEQCGKDTRLRNCECKDTKALVLQCARKPAQRLVKAELPKLKCRDFARGSCKRTKCKFSHQ
jgi:hypothetical protein